MCLFGRERERERGCCAVERIKVVGFDGDRLWWQWLLWVDATKVNIKFYSLGFYWCDGLVQTNQRRISAKAFVRRWLPNPSNKEHLIIQLNMQLISLFPSISSCFFHQSSWQGDPLDGDCSSSHFFIFPCKYMDSFM
jgi:hypothetical protein